MVIKQRYFSFHLTVQQDLFMSDNSLKKGRYTRYSNKIGLYSTSQDQIGFLNNNNDVVLSFPFKDTILEAGMSKEDVGREERFLHQEVDSSDIDTLIYAELSGDFPLGDSRQPTYKSLRPFDLVS